MMKRNKAILCALASVGFITSINTISANAMTMPNATTTRTVQAKMTVSKVIDLINELPYKVTLKTKDEVKNKVEKARSAYNSLDENEQKRIDSYTLDTLKSIEEKLEKVESDELKAKNLIDRIKELEYKIWHIIENNKGDKHQLESKLDDELNKNLKEIQKIREDYNSLDYYVKHGMENLDEHYEFFLLVECELVNKINMN